MGEDEYLTFPVRQPGGRDAGDVMCAACVCQVFLHQAQ